MASELKQNEYLQACIKAGRLFNKVDNITQPLLLKEINQVFDKIRNYPKNVIPKDEEITVIINELNSVIKKYSKNTNH